MERVEVLFECPEFVVCVKPTGVLSQSGKGGISMITLLEQQLGGDIYPVHRLDRETGGVMVYARTSAAAAELSRQIQQGETEKEYLAVLKGVPKEQEGTLEDILFHDSHRNKSYVVKKLRKGARQAKLCYRVLEIREGKTLVQIRLFTGRTHQVRVQFSSRGWPLCGDRAYGGGGGGLCLWACRLTLRFRDGVCRSFTRIPEELGIYTEIPPLVELVGRKDDDREKVLDKAPQVQ